MVNLVARVKVEIFRSFFNNSMVARVHDKHFKFHKVMQGHCSGEVGNVRMILQQIHSGNCPPNLIRIA